MAGNFRFYSFSSLNFLLNGYMEVGQVYKLVMVELGCSYQTTTIVKRTSA